MPRQILRTSARTLSDLAFAISSSYRLAVFGYSPAVVHPTLQEFSMRMRTLLLFVIVLSALPLLAVDIHDTRLLSEPAVSGDRIAFSYANDLWVANLDGSGVRRLTSHPGVESAPKFSPDGKLIPFTGRYEGNTDVYVVPAEGGVPRRLTWHPQADVARGFTADGASVL